MQTKVVTTQAPKATGPFSQAIVANGLVFTAGQIHLTPEGVLLEAPIEEQVRQVMRNLQAILETAGVTFKNVVKTTIFVIDMSQYGAINTIYGSYMIEPYPAREVVCVKELPLGAKVEISMIAVKE